MCNLFIRGAHCSLLWLASCSCFSSGQWVKDNIWWKTTFGERGPSVEDNLRRTSHAAYSAAFFRQLGRLVNDCHSDIGWNICLELYISLMNFTDGLVFLQFWVFVAIFEVHIQKSFFAPFEPFILLKMSVSISRFQCKNRFEKGPALSWDIWEKSFLAEGLVWYAMFK